MHAHNKRKWAQSIFEEKKATETKTIGPSRKMKNTRIILYIEKWFKRFIMYHRSLRPPTKVKYRDDNGDEWGNGKRRRRRQHRRMTNGEKKKQKHTAPPQAQAQKRLEKEWAWEYAWRKRESVITIAESSGQRIDVECIHESLMNDIHKHVHTHTHTHTHVYIMYSLIYVSLDDYIVNILHTLNMLACSFASIVLTDVHWNNERKNDWSGKWPHTFISIDYRLCCFNTKNF